MRVTEEHVRQYREDGYFVLESVISPEHLSLLRDEAQRLIDAQDRAAGCPPGRHDQRYVSEHTWRHRPPLRRFLFCDLMADICRATLGPEALLFYEQFVIKGPENGRGFSWHQDSGYVGPNHKPYVTCWCALDDMSEANGTVRILPQSVCGIRTFVQHVRNEQAGDLVGYFGRERGVPVVVPAGSIAVFSSYTFHASAANTADRMRRVYLAQYAREPVYGARGNLSGTAEPFLRDGANVAELVPDSPTVAGARAKLRAD